MISALADVAGGMAVWSALAEPMSRVSTIDLRVDYLRPGKPDALIAESKVLRIGGRMGVSDITIFHAGAEGDPVAIARGAYAVKIHKHGPSEAG